MAGVGFCAGLDVVIDQLVVASRFRQIGLGFGRMIALALHLVQCGGEHLNEGVAHQLWSTAAFLLFGRQQ